ncbi:MAG: hypothetical protein GWN58_39420, partial [Anaerolineae bacterium]|nr:hypothetical protein [Anaerolineae bacterium]
DLIRPFEEDELIDHGASMDTALHQLISGQYQSLLVTRGDEVIGVLRLIDVYEGISKLLRAAGHEPAPQ